MKFDNSLYKSIKIEDEKFSMTPFLIIDILNAQFCIAKFTK